MLSPYIQKIILSSDNSIPVTSFLIGRIPGIKLPVDRQEALKVQKPFYQKLLKESLPTAFRDFPLILPKQVHGADLAIIETPFLNQQSIPNVDGLITSNKNIVLGVTVADCAPVWIIEKTGKVGAIIHSGKRGTEAGIVSKAITTLENNFQIQPENLIVTIGPCIRPPCYEVDFATTIREQARIAGVKAINDEKICTACHLDHYYSYRKEKGKTGHMLAILILQNSESRMK